MFVITRMRIWWFSLHCKLLSVSEIQYLEAVSPEGGRDWWRNFCQEKKRHSLVWPLPRLWATVHHWQKSVSPLSSGPQALPHFFFHHEFLRSFSVPCFWAEDYQSDESIRPCYTSSPLSIEEQPSSRSPLRLIIGGCQWHVARVLIMLHQKTVISATKSLVAFFFGCPTVSWTPNGPRWNRFPSCWVHGF